MNSTYIKIREIKINIDFEKRSSKSIVFIHGHCLSTKTWDKIIANPILEEYSLFAIDFPGHGKSDYSNSPDDHYSIVDLGRIIALVVENLELENFILVAVSMGANVACEALPFCSRGLKGIFMIAPSIIGNGISLTDFSIPHPYQSLLFGEDYNEEDLISYSQLVISDTSAENMQLIIDDYKKADPKFRSSLGKNLLAGKINDEISFLQNQNIPVVVVFGDKEKIIKNDYLDNADLNLWDNKVIKVAGAGHLAHIDNPEVISFYINQFAKEVLK